ncbi:MAG: selenoneine biosynthesis selenosugar synthase SenB [Proteobacteria bacterium]|nr:selenoneine biosynthesis selenosugar synthase SenB [Pseudomonadota bacterium]
MKIGIITPAKKHSRNGNRATALRWAGMLRDHGHSVRIDEVYDGRPCDLMIAIHAWRSAGSISRYREQAPAGPLIVALGGTDVNTFLKTDPVPTRRSMAMADALICLHGLIKDALPSTLHEKLHLIRQSARPLTRPRHPRSRYYGVCVVGHLRDEKDPFRTALAARLVPAQSRLRVHHLGKAHDHEWAREAAREMAQNPRYHWIGEVAKWRVRREFERTHLMVISSNQEGGANVVSEAIAAGVPIIASDIDGNVGLLGKGYRGYYPVGDERALAALLWRGETDTRFLPSLQRQCDKLCPLFTPESESRALARVVKAASRAVTRSN